MLNGLIFEAGGLFKDALAIAGEVDFVINTEGANHLICIEIVRDDQGLAFINFGFFQRGEDHAPALHFFRTPRQEIIV